ncbi:MAG: DUF1972 domain-containing protein [Bacteroidia bacterium]
MKSKQRISIIGTVGLPAKYGGFETLTDHLVSQLSEEHDITVYCSKKKYSKEERISTYKGAKLKYINLDANGIQSIPYDSISILRSLFHSDILLILGVAGAWMLPFVKLFTRKKIIISIDGIEWKREKWSTLAKLYLRWAEKMAVKFSHADISDNESIQDYTAMRYGTISRVIEYGADHTMKVTPETVDVQNYPFLNLDYAFKVCRIEPENNVHVVLEAFAKMPKKLLVMVGNWEANSYGKKLKAKYSKNKNLLLFDPIYNQRTIDMLRGNASLYIHGHTAGGTNPSLVEAMYLGLPIISYNVSYNKTTTENRALYFKTEKELIELVSGTSVHALSYIADQMGDIAQRRYNWSLIAKKYNRLFHEVLAQEKKQRISPISEDIEDELLEEYGASHLRTARLIFEK